MIVACASFRYILLRSCIFKPLAFGRDWRANAIALVVMHYWLQRILKWSWRSYRLPRQTCKCSSRLSNPWFGGFCLWQSRCIGHIRGCLAHDVAICYVVGSCQLRLRYYLDCVRRLCHRPCASISRIKCMTSRWNLVLWLHSRLVYMLCH